MKVKDRTGQLVKLKDRDAIFQLTGNNCPLDHIKTVLSEYFETLNNTNQQNADLGLFCWGIKRIDNLTELKN
jgi:hypothetical protein